MESDEINTSIANTGINKWYRRISSDEVFVKSPCVFTENPYHLRIGDVYEIHDLKSEEGSIRIGYVKLLWTYIRGYVIHFIAVDIQEGDLIHFSQRLGSDSIPCDFLICDLLYFDVESLSTKILRGLTDKDMELLEFDFSEK